MFCSSERTLKEFNTLFLHGGSRYRHSLQEMFKHSDSDLNPLRIKKKKKYREWVHKHSWQCWVVFFLEAQGLSWLAGRPITSDCQN